MLHETCFGDEADSQETQFENLSQLDDAVMSSGPTAQPSSFFYKKATSGSQGARGALKNSSSSFNQRSKGILRFKKQPRKVGSQAYHENCENSDSRQRTGLNSILRTETDVQMSSDPIG